MRKLNLIGQRFGNLVVTSESPIRKNNRVVWNCKCDCGENTLVTTDLLRQGKTTSCGCKRKARIINFNKTVKRVGCVKNEIGNHYGFLTVLERAENRRQDTAAWLCQCKCGNKKIVSGEDLRKGVVNSCGCLKSIGESKIAKILEEANIFFVREKTFETCRFPDTNALARFDFYVDNKYLIEYDGIQHFNQDNQWYRGEKDNYKDKWAKENNIPLIRISYKELENITLKDLMLKEGE
jgi:very-short-patch-repair endonuclease